MAVPGRGAAGTRAGAAPAAYAIVGHVIVLGLVVVSAAYSVRFGRSFVAWWPELGAALSIAVEALKATLLVFIVAAWKGGQRTRAAAGVLVLVMTIAYSAVAVQYMASLDFGRQAAEADALTGQREALTTQLRAAERARDESAERVPAAALEAEIRGLLQTPGAGDCLTVDGKVTKAVCPRVAELRARKAVAEAREKGARDAETLSYQLAGLKVAPQAPVTTGRWLATLMAATLELATLFGLWVVGPIVRAPRVPAAAVGVMVEPEPVMSAGERLDALKEWLLAQPRNADVVAFTQRAAATAVAMTPSALSRALRSLAAHGWLQVVGTGRSGTRVRLLSL